MKKQTTGYFCSECGDTGLNCDTDHFSRLPCRACGGSGKRKKLQARKEKLLAEAQQKATDLKCKGFSDIAKKLKQHI